MIPLSRSAVVMLLMVPVFAVLISLIMITIIISSSRSHIFPDIASIPHAEAALILGAGVLSNGGLSSVLQDRADEAIDLYNAGKVDTLVASGNRSDTYNEVDPIVNYLVKHGVPPSAIVTDYAGYDTYSSIYRLRSVFAIDSFIIVTQSFHLPRALFIADNLGLTATGISADRGHYKLINYFREMVADLKATENLIIHRQPSVTNASAAPTDAGMPSSSLFQVW